jgi:superfamily II DNA/RNA helicase
VIATVGKELIALGQLVCHTFIGGIPLEEDLKHLLQQPNVIIGTPGTIDKRILHTHNFSNLLVLTIGRIKQLIEEKYLNVNNIKLFVFDEADKLFDLNFIEVILYVVLNNDFNIYCDANCALL